MAELQAGVRVKILVGRYTLQEDTNKYRGSDAPCPENLYHFLFVCTEILEVRGKYLKLIPEIVINSSCNTNWECIIKSPELQEKLLVDPDSPELGLVDPDSTFSIGSVARCLMYALHTTRARKLEQA